MGNKNTNIVYETVPSSSLLPPETDQEAINSILLTEDGKLTDAQTNRLVERWNNLVDRKRRLENDEPFKQHGLWTAYHTVRPTSQLRIAGKQGEYKLMLIQFKDTKTLFLQFQTEYNQARYVSSERNMSTWLFNPKYQETHHLVLHALTEKESIDNIRFVGRIELKDGVMPEDK